MFVLMMYWLLEVIGETWGDLADEMLDVLEEQTIVPTREGHQRHDLDGKRLQE
jgi:hypothetical protein